MQQLVGSSQRRGYVVGSRYQVGEVIGVGGMGVVYEAIERSLDCTAALKLPHPRRFRRISQTRSGPPGNWTGAWALGAVADPAC